MNNAAEIRTRSVPNTSLQLSVAQSDRSVGLSFRGGGGGGGNKDVQFSRKSTFVYRAVNQMGAKFLYLNPEERGSEICVNVTDYNSVKCRTRPT
jgi:hypothetical protein